MLCEKRLTKGFIAYMRPAREQRGYRFNYGISVTNFSADGTQLFLTFTFRSGNRYCCWASACHHGLLFDSDFERLRQCFQEAGVNVGRPMRIRMRVVCEGGALFAAGPRDAHPTYEPALKRWECMEIYDESAAEVWGARA
jgi:hypothetical protein